MKEIWKEIKGYEGLYQVSNLGKVRGVKRVASDGRNVRSRELKQQKTKGGYVKVFLSNGGKIKQFDVHRLVALTFIPLESHNQVVDHINGIKTDNRLENLQFITQRHNASKDRRGGSSKYVGVSWSKISRKWKVGIRVNNKNQHLGYFEDEYEAHLAYQNKLKEYEESNRNI